MHVDVFIVLLSVQHYGQLCCFIQCFINKFEFEFEFWKKAHKTEK